MSESVPFALRLRVYWEDTDAAGIVYYANYLRFLERARTEWLRTKGYDQRGLSQRHGIVFVVRSSNLEFLRPARLDDDLIVTVNLVRLRAGSFDLRQHVERDSETLVTAEVKIACVRIGAIQPVRIPRELRDAFIR